MKPLLVDILPWVLSAMTLLMTWLQGNLDRRSWLVGLANQGLWLWFIVLTQHWGLLVLNAFLWILYVRNFRRWREVTRALEDSQHLAARPAGFERGVPIQQCSVCGEPGCPDHMQGSS